MNKETELKMLNNRIYGRSFGKGNNDDVGVEWNTVLKLLKSQRAKVEKCIDDFRDIKLSKKKNRRIRSLLKKAIGGK